ncbi:MAG: hypothetical protein H6709_10285 [Kofleriaceae bacterium]|nr:hypothetical protein [Myxococcales bacterium]MCB9564023.1 hypothetical protein [Kofleriaceae bacterium]MCB9572463.1 hypothetical protein [Kofleriaceae bacterium]
MTVRYHRLWGPLFLAIAAGNGVLFTQVGNVMFLVLAGLIGVVGVLYLVRPLLVIEDGHIDVKGLGGGTRRRFAYGDLAELQVEPGAIVVGRGDNRVRLGISRVFVHAGDLRRLAGAVRDARAAAVAARDAAGTDADAAD